MALPSCEVPTPKATVVPHLGLPMMVYDPAEGACVLLPVVEVICIQTSACGSSKSGPCAFPVCTLYMYIYIIYGTGGVVHSPHISGGVELVQVRFEHSPPLGVVLYAVPVALQVLLAQVRLTASRWDGNTLLLYVLMH